MKFWGWKSNDERATVSSDGACTTLRRRGHGSGRLRWRTAAFVAVAVLVGVFVALASAAGALNAAGSSVGVNSAGADYVVMNPSSSAEPFNYVDLFAPTGTQFTGVSASAGACTIIPAGGRHISCQGMTVAPGSQMTVHGDAAGLNVGASHQICVANTSTHTGGCVNVDAIASAPPTVPNPALVCGRSAKQLKALWLLLHRGKRAASAKGRPSALQGQCTLPPRGPCLGQKGLLIDGGPTDDTLIGTPKGDTMNGHEGNDGLDGLDDNDLMRGGPGRDTLDGNTCDDVLFSSGNDSDATWSGGPGNDVLNGKAASMDGGPDEDYVVNGLRGGTAAGGGGDDLISVTPGEEMTVSGGPGSDTIDARNQSHDKIDCGPGKDTLFADAKDTFKGCETVKIT